MSPRQTIQHGNAYPYDAPDAWREEAFGPPPKARDWAHATARGVVADLMGRQGIKFGFHDVDEDTRKELVSTIAKIIREGAARRSK